MPDIAATYLGEDSFEEPRRRRKRRRTRPITYLYFGLFFLAVVVCSHAMMLTMPYFWDEAGYFIPAALDFFTNGNVVPHNITPTAHPPLLSMYLTVFWKVFGYAEWVTRLAMLGLGGLTLLGTFVLAIELCGSLAGMPALVAAGLLAVSPLFFTQSLLAQADLPAAMLTMFGLWLFLRDRHVAAAVVCTLLVGMKETGAVLPAVLLVWLAVERRWKEAAWYGLPLAALGAWLLGLRLYTGFWLGSGGYGSYHTRQFGQPSQLAIGLGRRLYFLFVSNLHVVGTVGLVMAWRAGALARRRWRVVGVFAAAHLVVITLFGSAMLERYLVPLLPLFYTAAVVGFHQTRQTLGKLLLTGALGAGLVVGLFLNPPLWPFPYENNLAMADFAELQQRTADYLAEQAGKKAIATAWPLAVELTQPRLGYVQRRLTVFGMRDFSEDEFSKVPDKGIDVFVRYSRDWDPPRTLLADRRVRWVARYWLGYKAPVSPEQIEQRLKLKLVTMFEKRGQWVEIYAK